MLVKIKDFPIGNLNIIKHMACVPGGGMAIFIYTM